MTENNELHERKLMCMEDIIIEDYIEQNSDAQHAYGRLGYGIVDTTGFQQYIRRQLTKEIDVEYYQEALNRMLLD
jgi:hypothetical protein